MTLSKAVKKVKRRLKKRKGNVIFIESAPDGMKDRLVERAEKNGRSLAAECVAIFATALGA